MKKTFKRFLAFAMVAVLMANPMSALAAETTEETTSPAIGSADASGDVEGFVDTTIFKVVLPTSAEGTFDFIMDPQGLIAATSGDAYGGTASADFEEDATVFFQTASADAAKKDYKSTSNYIQVLNRGTVDVNVTVEATIDGLSDIAMAADEAAFTSGDAAVPELYLAFTASGDASGDAKDAPVALTKDGAKITAVLDAADQDMYEFNYASGEYTFDLKDEYVSGDADDFADYSFALTGACNSEADWTDVKTAVPAVNVVWTLEDTEADTATPTDVAWSSTGQYFYLSVPNVETLDMSKLSNIRVVQDSVDEVVSTYNKSESGKYITITWSTIKTNLLWPASNPGKTITFNFTYDGVQYTATYSAE